MSGCFGLEHADHRRYEYEENGKRQSDIQQVPSFWPDTETVRNDMLDYGLEIEHADRHLGCMIETLEERGLDNTVIVMTSDNGMPFPR